MTTTVKLFISIIAILAIGMLTIHSPISPWSAARIEMRVLNKTLPAFGSADWANGSIDGQRLIIAGEAPDVEAIESLTRQILSSSNGSIADIDTRAITIAAGNTPETEIKSVAPDDGANEDAPTKITDLILRETASISSEPSSNTSLNTSSLESTPAPDFIEEQSDPDDEAAESVPAGQVEIDDVTPCISDLQTTIDNGRVTFATAQIEINNASRNYLNKLARALNECPSTRLSIIGHTDNVGSSAGNQSLSDYRASAVAAYLAALGVNRNRLVARGVGATQPTANNATLEGRRQNRRIEISILKD